MIKEINIKEDFPSVDVAIFRIQQEIEVHKQFGDQVIKIIHGYGSHGVGGNIKEELNHLLPIWKKQNYIYDYIKGENFTSITLSTRKYSKDLKYLLMQDEYFDSLNKGVTIIITRSEK